MGCKGCNDQAVLGWGLSSFTSGAAAIAKKTAGAVSVDNMKKGLDIANAVRSGDPIALAKAVEIKRQAAAGDKDAQKALAVINAADKLAIKTGVSAAKRPECSFFQKVKKFFGGKPECGSLPSMAGLADAMATKRSIYGTGLALSAFQNEKKYGSR